ncbi:hypothetical protein ANCCEY_13800 [Ancylostoma ceylanicum]|uniref:G-protein coupled receptors family 1 profile domain-containing protein n=2 Tax=Ancylostoma ceylanicum TaxID=53326 RepID=A0A8I3B1D8_9BILA|nr:hypothetical protein ANCCEY_13800 [Ancylostoma ceylanicum]EYC23885.1 hypothetical protein Y032_0014g2199 [Ancylostoma ceylanicum]
MEETSMAFENASTTLPPPVEGNMGLLMNESMSTTNMQAIEVVPVVAAGVVFGTLVAIGTIATAIFIAVLIRGKRKFAEFPFFVIVWHLTVANATHMVMVISTIMPIMLLEIGDDTPKREWYIWGSRILELTEQASLYFALLMTINRFAVFVIPTLLFAFTRTRTMIMCFLMWVYIFFIVTWNVAYGSTKNFSKKKLSMQETLLGSNFLTTFFTLSSTVLPIVMLVMYGIIFLVIIKKRGMLSGNSGSSEKDRSLLWQALAVSVMLELTKLTSMITPYFKETDSWVQWCWTIFSYSTSILNQMVNPFLFLTMNKMVRHVLRRFFKRGSDASSESGENPKTDPTLTGFRRKISRALLKSKRILLNHQPVDRSTWVM